LPDPKTFRLLCVVPEAMEEYSDSEIGIVKSSQSMHYEEVLTPVLFVVKVGPDAYKDTTRFPNGPSCKEGDFVIVRPNSGTRLKIHGREFRIINDDSVEAVVEDPRGITRAA
jgi:co-chaperonin GroES (HSP10)